MCVCLLVPKELKTADSIWKGFEKGSTTPASEIIPKKYHPRHFFTFSFEKNTALLFYK